MQQPGDIMDVHSWRPLATRNIREKGEEILINENKRLNTADQRRGIKGTTGYRPNVLYLALSIQKGGLLLYKGGNNSETCTDVLYLVSRLAVALDLLATMNWLYAETSVDDENKILII